MSEAAASGAARTGVTGARGVSKKVLIAVRRGGPTDLTLTLSIAGVLRRIAAGTLLVFSTAHADDSLDSLFGPAAAAPATEPAVTPAANPQAAPAAAAIAEPAPAAEAAPATGAAGEGAAATATTTAKLPTKAHNALIEEIVVTAQKREESLTKVPISIQAFSPDALAARGIDNQLGLTRAVPSLNVGSQAGYATIFLRGIGTEAFLTADPSIASYVDGVYFPFSPTFVQDFAGVQRVEVLKGPQGTLFGRNAVGGAISVTSLAPSFTDRTINADVTVGNFGLVKPRLYANFPISDSFAANFSAYYAQSDSNLDSASRSGGKPLRPQYDEGVRLRTRWVPFEDLEVAFGLTRTRNQGNGAIGQNLTPSPLGKILGIQPPDNPRDVQVDTRLYGISETRLLSTQLTYNAPWLDVKVLASKQHDSLLYNYDFDGSTKPLVAFDVPGHPANIAQGELQLISNRTMPYSDWLDVTGGVFLFHNIQGFNPVQLEVGDLVTPGIATQLAGLLPNGLPLVSVAGQVLSPGRAYRVQAQAQVKTISSGYYLQTTTRFTDWMALTLGARYQREDRGLHKSTVNLLAGTLDTGAAFTGGPEIVYTTARDADGNVVPGRSVSHGLEPKVTLDFHPFLDDTLVFASFQKAKKAQGYNAFAIYLPPQYIKPEKTTSYEIGTRTPLFDGLMHFDAAAFYYRIHDLQTQYVSLVTGGALAFQNAPFSESKGVDFNLVSEILPSYVDAFAVSLNGAYIDAKFVKYPNAAGFQPGTELFTSNNDFSGKRQTRTPKISGTLALTKLWKLAEVNEVEFGADYYYSSKIYYAASNDPAYSQKSYGLLGSFVRYKYVPWNMDVRLYGKNLLDKFYTQGVISTDFGGVFSIAAPREFGATVSWKF